MKSWLSLPRLAVCLSVAIYCKTATAQNPPADFASITVSSQWNEVVGLVFSEDGQDMFVWERAGRVWVVRNNQRQLLLDISEEVGAWFDHGMLGFALHPHFDENGQFYLMYLVDRYHLKNFGTAGYNPTANEYQNATIGRVTRYTASKNGSGYTIVPGSRKILIGESITTGIPALSITHSTGSLVFGTDNTLLISIGDGASPDGEDSGGHGNTYHTVALADGIIRQAENVGAFRSQLLDCYNGKILRIDAENGQGLPSNPFYDPARPSSAKSRVWALGLRNPFRMSLKPGTGSHNPADGNPGILYVGDVGWNQWEEINVVDRPGENFGWPIYEGHNAGDGSLYPTILKANRDSPNPLFNVNGCTQEYFNFQDLIKQETPSGTATFTNPCNGSQNIPANIPTFVHSRPLLAWHHGSQLPRVATFNGQTATIASVSPGASPVPGPSFMGRCAAGGLFYTGADFNGYQNSYFFGDYATGWIRNITLDANDKPTSVRNFVNENAVVVAFATHPSEPGLYYVNFPSEIRKIYFSNNRPPVAVATADKTFGPSPLVVQFKGDGSTDPENQPLAYEWNFGDASPVSNATNPSHTFSVAGGIPTLRTVTLKVTDNQGVSHQATINISINNTPPQVTITNPVDNSLYSITTGTQYTLHADVSDAEFANNQLTYRWQTVLHHDTHVHPSPPDAAVEPVVQISPLGCDGQTYFYRIVLTVTDPAGAATSKEVRVYPDCGATFYRAINLNGPALVLDGRNWEASTSAPGFSFANGTPFSNQSVTLVPATDGTRATMIRSSIYGNNVGVALGNIPAGTYQVYLYVWEDNNPEIFSVSLEANVVRSNFYSGTMGSWTKLGPYQANITDGTINVNATGGAANLSGLEIWTVSVQPSTPPTVSNPIADQTATVGVTYSFSFPSNTFSGSGLSYTAALSNGNALPSWLTFNPTARTFSGTPTSSNTGTIEIRVTASNGNGSANDLFNLAVNDAGTSNFYRAINLNGPPLVIDNRNWEASTSAPGFSFTNGFTFSNQSVTLIPSTDANRATMIRSSIYGSNVGLSIANVPAGTYQIYLYVWEDNNAETFSVSLEGSVVRANFNSGVTGSWTKLGPYQANITDGTINVNANGGAANLSGLEVWSTGGQSPPPPPTVSNPIADQSATVGVLYNFAFASNTFSGSGLSYAAALSNGSMLPSWLTFNPTTRTFSGTPTSSNTGTIEIRVTASNAHGSVHDLFNLAVNEAGTSNFYRAINLNGPGLVIDGRTWEASTSAPGFSFTNGFTFSNQSVTLIPSTDANRATMIRSSIYGSNVGLAIANVPAGTYQIYLYVWEDNNAETFSVSLEGTVVRANFNSGAMGSWTKLGPYQANITDGVINVNADGGAANLSGLEVWSTSGQATPPPAVSNPIPDQVATVGAMYNFSFSANTFSGTGLSYSATLSNGSNLPSWLSFNATTRTFSGTPTTSTAYDVRVTANNAGGSANDLFNITVNAAGAPAFYRAINLNGPALVIDGNNWQASASAPGFSSTSSAAFSSQSVTLVPATDANRATMIRSSIWGRGFGIALANVPTGTYQVYLYVWEDNNPEIFSVLVEGTVVRANYNSGAMGSWTKLGPYQVNITDGTINVNATGGAANFSGLEVWSVPAQSSSTARLASGTAPSATLEMEETTAAFIDLTAFPNPFSDKVTITFTTKQTAYTRLVLLDARGVQVKMIFDQNSTAGTTNRLEVENRNLANGMYMLQLINGNYLRQVRLAILR